MAKDVRVDDAVEVSVGGQAAFLHPAVGFNTERDEKTVGAREQGVGVVLDLGSLRSGLGGKRDPAFHVLKHVQAREEKHAQVCEAAFCDEGGKDLAVLFREEAQDGLDEVDYLLFDLCRKHRVDDVVARGPGAHARAGRRWRGWKTRQSRTEISKRRWFAGICGSLKLGTREA